MDFNRVHYSPASLRVSPPQGLPQSHRPPTPYPRVEPYPNPLYDKYYTTRKTLQIGGHVSSRTCNSRNFDERDLLRRLAAQNSEIVWRVSQAQPALAVGRCLATVATAISGLSIDEEPDRKEVPTMGGQGFESSKSTSKSLGHGVTDKLVGTFACIGSAPVNPFDMASQTN